MPDCLARHLTATLFGRTQVAWHPAARLAIRHTVRLGLCALLIGCFTANLQGAENPRAEKPRIVGCDIGLGGTYKLGTLTPITLQVEGGDEPMGLTVVAVTPDSDGLGVATTPLGNRPLSTEPGIVSESRLYVRVGKEYSPITVKLMRGSKVINKRSFGGYLTDDSNDAFESKDPIAPGRLVWLSLGASAGLETIASSMINSDSYSDPPHVARLSKSNQMPFDWIGYEGIDVVWLVAGDGKWLSNLSAESPQIIALKKWVESGGRLILSCGEAGAELLGPGGALSTLLPGKFDSIASLRRTSAIESFAGSKKPLDLHGGILTVSQIIADKQTVKASDGSSDNAIPLVVRRPFGFGEVTFVAFDLSNQALTDWSGQKILARQLLGNDYKGLGRYQTVTSNSNYRGTTNSDEILPQMLGKLDRSFVGVSTTPFILIAGLVIGYLLLIGPGDYWFTIKVLKRPEATWVTFPLVVLLTSVAAYWAAGNLKGNDLRVNQVEILDINVIDQSIRGLAITHLFSPKAERYSLSLAMSDPAGESLTSGDHYCSWLGKPGYGLGSMQGGSGNMNPMSHHDYLMVPLKNGDAQAEVANVPSLAGMPIQVWSTKTMLSRWQGQLQSSLEADLSWNEDRLIEGTLTNATGTQLNDCYLLAGDWAWRLKKLNDGATATIDSSLSPIKITTLMKKEFSSEQIDTFAANLSLTGRELTNQGEQRGAHLAFCDLSHHLAAGQAILLAKAPADASPRCQLQRDGKPLASDKDRLWTFYRFLMPIQD